MNLTAHTPRLPALTSEALGRVRAFEAQLAEQPNQLQVATHHVIHGGMYSRTVTIPAGVAFTGARMKRTTLLIITGHVRVYAGEGYIDLAGHNVLAGSAGRKGAFLTFSEVSMTMVFPTTATTVQEAEAEFTDETHLLMSNHAENTVVITGE